jgi:hypothetical protein
LARTTIRHRVPANDVANAPFQFQIAGISGLLIGRNGVDVRRVESERNFHAHFVSVSFQSFEQSGDAVWPGVLQDVIERFEPFLVFELFDSGGIIGFGHDACSEGILASAGFCD